jgi:hypothetical protein
MSNQRLEEVEFFMVAFFYGWLVVPKLNSTKLQPSLPPYFPHEVKHFDESAQFLRFSFHRRRICPEMLFEHPRKVCKALKT